MVEWPDLFKCNDHKRYNRENSLDNWDQAALCFCSLLLPKYSPNVLLWPLGIVSKSLYALYTGWLGPQRLKMIYERKEIMKGDFISPLTIISWGVSMFPVGSK